MIQKILKDRLEFFPKSLYHSYENPLLLSHGDSHYYYSVNNEEPYIDLYNNVCHIGHSNPLVLDAVNKCYSTININTRYLNTSLTLYASHLMKYIPNSEKYKIIFTNSGSESNDLALQIGMNYCRNINNLNIGSFETSYHGTTWLCNQVSHIDSKGFIKDVDFNILNTKFVPRDEKINEKYGLFIMEVIQGVGGNYDIDHDIVRNIRNNSDILICDEVQTGFGRSGGTFWAFEKTGIIPDIITCGKPIANGYPMGACIFRKELEPYINNNYFNTFGGNNVACSIAKVVLEEIENKEYIKHSEEMGNYIKQLLGDIENKKYIKNITGSGLFLGIHFVDSIDVKKLVECLKDNMSVIAGIGYGNCIRIKPPLTITKSCILNFVLYLDILLN